MKTNQVMVIAFYALIAVLALVCTFSQNMNVDGGFGGFLQGARETPVARSLAIDISLFLEAAAVFMVIEARRLGIRLVWLYLVGGFLIAISVTFPLFMIAREMRLAPAAKADTPWSVTTIDVIGLALVTALVAAICWTTLT